MSRNKSKSVWNPSYPFEFRNKFAACHVVGHLTPSPNPSRRVKGLKESGRPSPNRLGPGYLLFLHRRQTIKTARTRVRGGRGQSRVDEKLPRTKHVTRFQHKARTVKSLSRLFRFSVKRRWFTVGFEFGTVSLKQNYRSPDDREK